MTILSGSPYGYTNLSDMISTLNERINSGNRNILQYTLRSLSYGTITNSSPYHGTLSIFPKYFDEFIDFFCRVKADFVLSQRDQLLVKFLGDLDGKD